MSDSIRLHPLGDAEPYDCPICHYDYSDAGDYDEDSIHHAAHCCLWKFVGHSDRVRIAELVERGAKWEQAIEKVAHAHCA